MVLPYPTVRRMPLDIALSGKRLTHGSAAPPFRQALCARRFAMRLHLTAVLIVVAFLAGYPRPLAAGTLVSAACSCGYSRPSLPLFGGFANFKTVCLFPGLCQATGQLVLFNVLDPMARPRDCPHGDITSYADPALAPQGPGETVASWNIAQKNMTLTLTDGGYYCPQCKRKTLHFTHSGMWD